MQQVHLPGDPPGAETPKEKFDKAELMERIKKHVLVVLRRADEQKIPMEVPEATELAKVLQYNIDICTT
jgi:hypothetical protein